MSVSLQSKRDYQYTEGVLKGEMSAFQIISYGVVLSDGKIYMHRLKLVTKHTLAALNIPSK